MKKVRINSKGWIKAHIRLPRPILERGNTQNIMERESKDNCLPEDWRNRLLK